MNEKVDQGASFEGTVTARTCDCCGHHEIGMMTQTGAYVPLKPGMKIRLPNKGINSGKDLNSEPVPAQSDIVTDVRGYMKSRVILTAAELNFFTELDGNTVSAKDLADKLGLNERATTRILDCLVTYDLIEKKSGGYRTTQVGSQLSSRHPADSGSYYGYISNKTACRGALCTEHAGQHAGRRYIHFRRSKA